MTLDLRPKWLNVTRSLQKAACKNNGIAVVSTSVVVDSGGDPVTWIEPDVKRLGPLSSQDDLIRLLGELPSGAYRDEFLIAQVIDSRRLAINAGDNRHIKHEDWFAYIQNNRPYVILCVEEVKTRATILRSMWVSAETPKIKNGDPLHKLKW